MPKIKKPKLIAAPSAIEAAAPAPAASATIGSNSANVSVAFVHGRNIGKSFADAVKDLDLPKEQAAIQELAVKDLKIGLIFDYFQTNAPKPHLAEDGVTMLGVDYCAMTDLEAYETAKKALETPGKRRTELERKAEVSARTEVSRIFSKYGLTNWNAKGGSNKMTEEERKAAAAKKAAEAAAAQTAKMVAEGWVKTDGNQIAAFVTPNMTTGAEFADQLLLFGRGLKATLAKAENLISANDQKAIRPKMAAALSALEEIVAMIRKKDEAEAITAQAAAPTA